MKNIDVTNFIGNIENRSRYFGVSEMINICKRKNNAKRDYLFVNSFQGKHIPQSPAKILTLFEELLREVKRGLSYNERVLVVGFAETATAIGHYIANNLENCVFKLQTTREEIVGAKKVLNFEEEHSHAVGQWLYAGEDIPEYDRIIFVEDEITTGKTILNFIAEFSKINPNTKYSVASILNWQNAEDTLRYKDAGIDTYFVVRGELKEGLAPIELMSSEPVKVTEGPERVQETFLMYPFVGNERLGSKPQTGQDMKFKMSNILETLKEQGIVTQQDKNIAVVGTEEFMYIPLVLARLIEIMGKTVKYHATTRSPITVADTSEYAITNGVTLSSAYAEDRVTYLYNLNGGYDKVLVVTDVDATQKFKKEITALWESKGAKEVYIIQMV